ncbi:MAG: hypothetical protein KAG28_09955 [Cocleimonas sp.]|nr:hypothetical protein [Cocleimonas sp.]
MKKIIMTGFLIFPLLISPLVLADEITDQIDTGLKAYKDKDYKGAIEEFKFITVQLQKLEQQENTKLLPEPLKGWLVKKNKENNQVALNILGGGTSVSAEYQNKRERVKIEIVANSPMLAMVNMMISNPMIAASNANAEPYRYKRIKGIKEKKGKNTVEITLLMAGQVMVKVTGRYLQDEAVLKQYLDAMDMKKIKAALL